MISYLHDKHEEFHECFIKQYTPHMNEWATCYRASTIVNTNTFCQNVLYTLKRRIFKQQAKSVCRSLASHPPSHCTQFNL